MAQVSGTYSKYDAVGLREDLTDIIYNISPTDTPFMSSIAKTKATAVNHEWQ
ncbi:head protein, partial [bacterium]|nr:head protein [bacterium]